MVVINRVSKLPEYDVIFRTTSDYMCKTENKFNKKLLSHSPKNITPSSNLSLFYNTGRPHSTLFSVPEKHSLDRNSLDRGLCYLL